MPSVAWFAILLFLLWPNLFTNGTQGPMADFTIMALHLATQALLVAGVLRALDPAADHEPRLGWAHGRRSRQAGANQALPER